ncbi:MAG: hypothetical protein P8P74_16650 [Crocinitomicaceae bacterium]|nr:hypothetical protein [Crocinitomicaceae bacterium]
MIKRTLQFSLAFAGVLFLLQSCSKVEGPGGSSTISGKIHVEVYDVAGNLINEYDAQDEDVYLIYGNEGTFYDDDVKTSFDGTFEFRYLQKGNYQLFVYQDCNSCASGKEAVIVNVEITDNKTTTDIGTITIID